MNAEQLTAIIEAHGKWLSAEGGAPADLRYANLRDANLRGVNLRGADLRGVNLRCADLRYANLRDADLSGADLRYANLRGVNLRGVNLSGVNLCYADLRGVNLSYANLRDADLSGADLRGVNLSGALGIPDTCEWIAKNLQRARGGVYAYKTFGEHYKTPDAWKIEPGAEISENVDQTPTIECGCGVNVATLDWCKCQASGPIWKVLVKWEWLAGGVIPYRTDGKFRVPRAKLIEIVER